MKYNRNKWLFTTSSAIISTYDIFNSSGSIYVHCRSCVRRISLSLKMSQISPQQICIMLCSKLGNNWSAFWLPYQHDKTEKYRMHATRDCGKSSFDYTWNRTWYRNSENLLFDNLNRKYEWLACARNYFKIAHGKADTASLVFSQTRYQTTPSASIKSQHSPLWLLAVSKTKNAALKTLVCRRRGAWNKCDKSSHGHSQNWLPELHQDA